MEFLPILRELVDARVDFVVLEEGLVVRVLDLPGLIEVKEATGRDKDRAQLPLLRATLAERLKRGDPWIPLPPGGDR